MEPKRISSLSNPVVKAAAKLKQPRTSKEAGCFIVEGVRSVEELPEAWETESLWVSDTFWEQNHAWGWETAREAPALFVLQGDGGRIECCFRHPVAAGDSRGGCAGAILLCRMSWSINRPRLCL